MKTAFGLLAQYDGAVVIPLDRVCKDYFNLTPDKFLRKVASGEIKLPIVRMGSSQKCAKGVHLSDLAAYIDACRDAAIKEQRGLAS